MKFQWIILALALSAGLLTRYVIDSKNPALTETSHPLNILESGQQAIDLYDEEDPRLELFIWLYTLPRRMPDITCRTFRSVAGVR